MPRKKKQKQPEFRLYIDYSEYITGGEAIGDGPFCDHEDEYREVYLNGVYRSMDSPKAPFFYDSKEVAEETFKKDTVYLVVVRYTTGNTFGTIHGAWHIEGIYPDAAQAAIACRKIEDGTYQGYKPWDGYFERLENVDIRQFDVKDNF